MLSRTITKTICQIKTFGNNNTKQMLWWRERVKNIQTTIVVNVISEVIVVTHNLTSP